VKPRPTKRAVAALPELDPGNEACGDIATQHTAVEKGDVGAISDVVEFQPMSIAALLAPVLGAEHCAGPHRRTRLTPAPAPTRHFESCF
jgi:hypothetical protein